MAGTVHIRLNLKRAQYFKNVLLLYSVICGVGMVKVERLWREATFSQDKLNRDQMKILQPPQSQ